MKRLLLLMSVAFLGSFLYGQKAVKITRLTTNDEVNPVCVNSVRLGWQTNCPSQGTRQTAYEIQVNQGRNTVYKSVQATV